MNQRPDEIFVGGAFSPGPKKPNRAQVEETVNENPNVVRAKWSQLTKFSSPFSKKIADQFALDLERMQRMNAWKYSGRELSLKIARDSQLALGNQHVQPAPEIPETTRTRPGAGKYAHVLPPRIHPMWTRSQEKTRKEKF